MEGPGRQSPDGRVRFGFWVEHRVDRPRSCPPSPRTTLQPGLPPLTLGPRSWSPTHVASGLPSTPTPTSSPLVSRPLTEPPHPPSRPARGPSPPLPGPAPPPAPPLPSSAPPADRPAPCVAPGPPSAPRDLQYSLSRSPLALRLRWLPPADSGGRSDVTYSLLCLRCGREGPAGACEPCGPRVAFVPRQAGLRERAATLLHLRPGARYTVRVAALNGVSGPAAAAGATYAQVTVSTGPGGKAAPRARPLRAPRDSRLLATACSSEAASVSHREHPPHPAATAK